MAARGGLDLEEEAPSTGAATGSSDSCVAVVVKKRLENLKLEKDIRQEEYSIFKVPSNLKAVGGIAYIPQMVSIGPYHYGRPQLKHMQTNKFRSLHQFLDRTKANVDCCIKTMAKLEHRARSCYSGLAAGKQLTSYEFVEMMLLDGCFILELLFSTSDETRKRNTDIVVRAAIPCIQRDLLMLENQIPLFVLEHLLAFLGDESAITTVTKLALDFFKPPILGRNLEDDDVAEIEKVNNLHLLHIILWSLLPSQSSNLPCISTDESKSRVMTHPVSMLRDYGVRFKKNNNSKYITDIVFDKGWLQIPRLVIDDSTRTILLNLMAFEQCCYWQCSNVATTFVSFMDDLINEPRDVMHLHRKGIIVHSLGSERAVAEMFNQVCREIAIRDDCTGSLSCELEKVNKFIHKKRHRWWASFRQEHLRHPWAIASVAGGALFLGLTIMATTYAMLAFHIYKS
ncbi:hypothetical protein MRB53_031907 [Persea americana]|uniref:Uncharacterized protein n=1 Tax=Persea americana TaxID=3435 RepID=A0ACC2KQF9_PERAE|nr:hypothetical protein MRB53_031907 [Persea americana]